ncbi:MAG: hypothetical protein AB8B52_06900 [Winogradskyella sp.]|uniref:hypothetical protein n=1 Tax=Winogradskyella sp. TaxID=1883156 RepID=UPI00385D26B1
MEDAILIDNYLKGLLSENDQKAFLERLKSDALFRENFKLEAELFNALDDNSWNFVKAENDEVKDYVELLEADDLKNLKKTLEQTNTEFNNEKKETSKRLFYYLAAASVVLFLGFQLLFNNSVTNQDLYNDYVMFSDLPSFVSRSDDANVLIEAERLFENKNYSEALVLFNSVKATQKYDGTLMIYTGLSELELGNYEAALFTFDYLTDSDFLDAEKGYWYKALALLKYDQSEEAKVLLDYIVSNNLFKTKEATTLLDQL